MRTKKFDNSLSTETSEDASSSPTATDRVVPQPVQLNNRTKRGGPNEAAFLLLSRFKKPPRTGSLILKSSAIAGAHPVFLGRISVFIALNKF